MRVLIGSELLGAELYGGEDPESLKVWLGKEVTVRQIHPFGGDWTFGIEEDPGANFFIEEVECIVDGAEEIEESDASLSMILGGSV
jgi:hypothetical protein